MKTIELVVAVATRNTVELEFTTSGIESAEFFKQFVEGYNSGRSEMFFHNRAFFKFSANMYNTKIESNDFLMPEVSVALGLLRIFSRGRPKLEVVNSFPNWKIKISAST